MNRGAWQTIVHGVAKSQTQLSEIFSWQAAFSFITSSTPTYCQTVSASSSENFSWARGGAPVRTTFKEM